MSLFNENTYVDKTFSELTLEKEQLQQIDFQNCQFNHCKFIGVTFSKIRFTDCDFESCDLSLAKLPGCRFSEVSFKNSKLAGINWTELSWPLVKLTSPLYFYSSNISHCSFFGLELVDLIIEDCKAHNVDFREANLTRARFVKTDLLNSLFLHTNLKSADFTDAINYSLDPSTNTVSGARFSFPEVVTLLHHLNIKINSWPNEDSD